MRGRILWRPCTVGAAHRASKCSRRQISHSSKPVTEQDATTNNNNNKSLLNILQERGFIKDLAGDRNALEKLLNTQKTAAYSGIDPTAPSLHLGHLLPIMVLFWMYIHGHKAVSIIGGATASIGDPTGRLTSRQHMDPATRKSNLHSLTTCVSALWKSAEVYAENRGYTKQRSWSRSLLDNSEWLGKLNMIDFLSDAGTVARMGAMLGRDTVKNKMAQGDGMSYAEFTYPLLQAYDWWHLYQSGVQIQIGGSDQYGNIIAGIDLIKHLTPRPSTSSTTKNLSGPFGLTVPLLTTATGAKFGKSAGNAVWLDKNMTSPFELYGFLVSSADADVQRYLKLFTFLPLTHISTVMHQHATNPSKRKAQHLLAREVVALVHGEEIAQSTQEQHFLSRNPNLQSLLKSEAVEEDDSTRGFERVYLPYSLVYMKSPARILYHAGLAKSNSDGMRMVNSGGAYIGSNNNNIINSINNQSDKTPDNKAQGQEKGEEEEEEEEGKLTFHPLKDMNAATITQTLQENKNMLILRTGKWNVKIIKVLSDEEFEQKGLAAPPGWEHVKEERN